MPNSLESSKAPKRRGTKSKHRLDAIVAVNSDTRPWNAEREEQNRGTRETRRDQAIAAADLQLRVSNVATLDILHRRARRHQQQRI